MRSRLNFLRVLNLAGQLLRLMNEGGETLRTNPVLRTRELQCDEWCLHLRAATIEAKMCGGWWCHDIHVNSEEAFRIEIDSTLGERLQEIQLAFSSRTYL
jgi:hypothetical protein